MSYDTSPSYPVPPHRPPHQPQYSSSQSYSTYPWAPQPQPEPGPAGPHRPRHSTLGQHSDIRVLRSAYRLQRRVATLTALGYFTLFLVLSAFAPSLMRDEVTDGLTVGLLLGLIQVPVTGAAIGLYEYTARRTVDPIAERLRKQAELDTRRAEVRP
ncbi:DUF485 domain-containing protein [Streptomyces sp. BH-SS-21]|uniref:DUF485 domain-containing protein n=1 Tax=Streptomyces liliiviolaceus TaxID=2823109 RepID=A0A940XN10_9ACTN|nr:DUF485 domain-containing protein [Streptomyces liliiviolaceus]MBQ0847096.1 DUF485 domain-containing protein [Streptomyces liliiviolaceus]